MSNKLFKKEVILKMNYSSNFKSNYFGSKGISTANLDLINLWKINPKGYTPVAYIFNFIADQDCTIVLNGSDPIPFKAGREFVVDVGSNAVHVPVVQFVIVESGIEFWHMGVFKDQ